MLLSEATTQEIRAIRSVRIAAHELANVCSAVVGGTAMAVSLPTVDTIGRDIGEIEPEGFIEGDEKDGREH